MALEAEVESSPMRLNQRLQRTGLRLPLSRKPLAMTNAGLIMDQIVLTVIATAVGGAIASFTAFWFDRIRERARLDQLKVVIVAGIKDDLTHSLSLYDRLQDAANKETDLFFGIALCLTNASTGSG